MDWCICFEACDTYHEESVEHDSSARVIWVDADSY